MRYRIVTRGRVDFPYKVEYKEQRSFLGIKYSVWCMLTYKSRLTGCRDVPAIFESVKEAERFIAEQPQPNSNRLLKAGIIIKEYE